MTVTFTLVVGDFKPFHFALSFCEVGLNSLYWLLIMADSRFVGDKPLTFDCDLDLYLSVKFDKIPFINF